VGRVFWVGALVELTGRPIAEVRDALGRLRVKELVVQHEPSSFRDEHEFAFRHGLIRDGAYDSLPKALRADKHLGTAKWAADRAGDRAEEIAELIATHEIEAVRYLDELGERRPQVERAAFDHAWAAARRTSALGLGAESTRWYREAERLAGRVEIPLEEQSKLFRGHAAESWGRDSSTESERVARRAIETFSALGDDRGRGWATGRLVLPLMQQSRHEDAEAAGRSAIQILEPAGESAELADALHRLGWFLWRRGRTREAEPLLRRAIDMAGQLDNLVVRAEATQTLAVCQFSLGKSGDGYQLMEEAFRLAKEAGDNQNLLRAYNNVASARLASLGPSATADVLREGLDLALRSGAIGQAGWIAGTLGDMEQLLGRLAEAEENQRLAVRLAQRVGDEPLTGQRLTSLATAVVMRGRIEEAVALRDQAAPILAANPEPQAAAFLPLFDGYVALGRRDLAAAAVLFAKATDAIRIGGADATPELFPETARTFLLLGDQGRASTYRDLDGSTSSVQSAAFAKNVAGLLEPHPPRAIDLLNHAIAELERLGMRMYAARAMVDLGRAMVRAGQDPHDVLDRARQILIECDAGLFLFEIDEVTAQSP
jgi:tetratricopeptide (TPR) repeat protein